MIHASNVVVHDVPTRPWADLLPELLSMIADRLGLIELLGFRGVCKGWRYASSTASAESESARELEPSFLVYGADKKCNFYYRGREKAHSISIPELDNSSCLASDHGWLLLAPQQQQQQEQASLFFFCPFSRRRIELPQFPHSELSDHVASFSAPPTSPGCILSVAYRPKNSTKIELHHLHRGDRTWTSQEFYFTRICTLTGSLYHAASKSFYFVDSGKGILEHSNKEQKLKAYTIITTHERGDKSELKTLPFQYEKHKLGDSNMKNRMGLQNDISISTCGTYFLKDQLMVIIENEKMEPPSLESPDGSARSPQLKGVWIHPRLHQIPPNQAW